MKFWTIETDREGTIGCELTKGAAREFAEARGLNTDEYRVEPVEVQVSAETIRRLLGNLGGFAES